MHTLTRRGGTATYMREIAKLSPLDEPTETALALRSRAGDSDARDRLIRASLPLVATLARGRHQRMPGGGVCLTDLIAEGNLALVRAVDKFTPGQGYRLKAHVRHHVREAFRELVLHASDRRLSYSHESLTQVIRFGRQKQALADRTGREPSFEEVADALGLTEGTRREMRYKLAAQRIGDFEHRSDGVRDEGSTMDPADYRGLDPRDEAERREAIERLRHALDRLDPEDAESLRLRFGIGCQPLPQKEIARRLGVCPTTLIRVQAHAHRLIAAMIA